LQGGTKPTTSKPGNTKSTDNAASGAGVADSTQPSAAHATTGIPPAAAISLAPQQGVASNTATGFTHSTGPLAIAAAAIARSSSTAAALTATPSPGKVDSLAVSPPGAKVAGEATVQTTARQPGPPTGPTLDAGAELTAAVATPGVTAAKPTTPAKTAATGTTGASATGTSANALEQASTTASDGTATPQPVVAIKGNATNTAADQINPGSGTTNPSPSTSTLHEQISISTDPQGSATPADNGAQAAVFTAPLQPASTVPSLTVAPATSGPVPLSGLAVEIAASVQSGRTRFEVRLDPADLGQIDVRIDVDRSGQVTSHLMVEKPETLSMLQQDAPQLQQALNDAGLKTGSGGLQFSLRDQSSSGQNNNGNLTNGNAHQLVVSEEDTVSPDLAGRYGRIAGTSGGIDIRV
jgi:flagellar hook-length control protein FliK